MPDSLTMFEISYLLCMVVFVVHGAEEIRENKDNDPAADLVRHLLRHSPLHQILVIVMLIAVSPFWPWFLLCFCLNWIGKAAERGAARLRAKVEQMEAAERGAAAAAKEDQDA